MLIHIQILRFFAAVAVVAFHVWDILPRFLTVPPETPSLGLWYAGHGVDLFFVISGFIIFYSTHSAELRGRPLTPTSFLRRRVERIVPLYFFAIAAVTVLALLLPAGFDAPGWYTPNHILKSLAFISFTDGEMPVVFVGWSLEYEMYFYLVVAILMATMKQVWRNVALLFSASVIVGQHDGVATTLGNYGFFTDPIIMEFVFGILAGVAFVHGRRAFSRAGLAMVLAASGVVATLVFTDPGSRALVFGLPSALFVALAACISSMPRPPTRFERVLGRLGDASFSIYLVQVNTALFATQAIVFLAPAIHPLMVVVLAGSLVVAAGLAMNIVVEQPLLALCRRIGSSAAGSARRSAARVLRRKFWFSLTR